ncbi:MAG TPA: TIGR00304 family protein [Candidatus Methanoperedens sp.]
MVEYLVMAGIALIIAGFFLSAAGIFQGEGQADGNTSYRERKEDKVKTSGVILIGPVPIVFGSDKRSAIIAMILAIVIMLLAIIFLKRS